MSGPLNYLTSLFTSSFGAGDPVLKAVYGTGQSGGASGRNPILAFAAAEKNETQDVKVTAALPAVQNAVTAFTKAVNGAKSLTDLLANPSVMNVMLTANGMSDQIGYTALAKKVLTSDLKDPKSLANTLADTRWKTLAQTYNFATKGLAAIQNPATIASIADKYAQFTWRQSEDVVTPGLSNALSFKANASTITSVDQILGDPTMRNVVTTTLGIPLQIAFQSMNAQEQAITTRVDIKKFQDPHFVATFVQRYLIAASANAASAASSTPDLTTLALQGRGILA